jgi:putative nucleotidyltransferase with HDIG domain
MARLDDIRQKVKELYEAKQEGRDDWSDWLYVNHVLPVAEAARSLAQKYGANVELSEIAALLHDIADYKMPRRNPDHEKESLAIARQLMADHGYTPEEIELTVEDAIRFHSCHGEERPKSKEGLVLATADSLMHLKTDFYIYAAWAMGMDKRPLEDIKDWTLKKIERDLNNKISFEDEREDAREDYEMIKELFSR